MSKIQETIEEWNELEPKKKWFLVALAFAGISYVTFHHFANEKSKAEDDVVSNSAPAGASSAVASVPGQVNPKEHLGILPNNDRNQGLEDLNTRLDQLENLIKRRVGDSDFSPAKTMTTDGSVKSPPASSASSDTAKVNLDAPLNPGKVDFNDPPTAPKKIGGASQGIPSDSSTLSPPPKPAPPEMKIWGSDGKLSSKQKEVEAPAISIPVNSGLDAVMLSGINARQPGSSTGAASSATSALNVGSPFVTRLKGDAILPNGWKLSELGDCFLGGSAVAILSTERANAIADTISCISPNGDVWEAPVKAYALDVDGTLGIAGKVVNKQGSILMQSALAGMASGLGSAFSPSSLPSYNTSAVSGQAQGYQLPNPSLIAGSAVGQGINTAAAQLSKFYLEFAREIFPVVEVVAGTRVTWILKETIELHKTVPAKVAKK